MSTPDNDWRFIELTRQEEIAGAKATLLTLAGLIESINNIVENQSETKSDVRINLNEFEEKNRQFLLATLGQGEVRIVLGEGEVKIENTTVPCLWRVESAEISELSLSLLPHEVIEAIDQIPKMEAIALSVDEGVFVAPAILSEIEEKRFAFDATTFFDREPDWVSLSGQPMLPKDREALDKALPLYPIEIYIDGFAQAKILSTKIKGVWKTGIIHHSGKHLIDGYSVGSCPAEVPNTPEEFEEAIEALAEMKEWIASSALKD